MLEKQRHVLESAVQTGRRLRCAFDQYGDRYSHQIELIDGDQSTLVLRSVEDDSTSNSPASGPLQELHVHQQTEGSHALMLVGKAGKNHWSLCVTADAPTNAIIFDAACRVREPVPFLGAVYDKKVASSAICVEVIDIVDGQPATIHNEHDRLIIKATCESKPPATIRWMYHISLSE